MNTGSKVIKAKNKKYRDGIEKKLDVIDAKLELVQAEVMPTEELGHRRKKALGRKNENDVLELEVKEEAREIRLETTKRHIGAMASYMDKIHTVLQDVNPDQKDLPNYVELATSVASLGEKVLELREDSKRAAPNVHQINLAVLAGGVEPTMSIEG